MALSLLFEEDSYLENTASHPSLPPSLPPPQVNILTWTAVGLVLVLLMALCLLYGADSGPKDSLLYAKFLADTSGGKMD